MGNWKVDDDGTVVISLRGDNKNEEPERTGLYIYGRPDDFKIMVDGFPIASCDYDSYYAYPFIISNNQLYIGSPGEGHWDIGCQLIGTTREKIYDRHDQQQIYDLECMRDAAVGRLQESPDYAAGRIWTEVKKEYRNSDEGKFDNCAIISFWDSWDKAKNVSGNMINQLLSRFKADSSKVYIANLDDDDSYGSLIEYKGGSISLSKMGMKRQQDYALHLMNAKDKHNATTDFRTTRDKKIGKKLTNDKGVEMPMAQYRSMIQSENINRIIRNVLKEYIYKNTKRIIF